MSYSLLVHNVLEPMRMRIKHFLQINVRVTNLWGESLAMVL